MLFYLSKNKSFFIINFIVKNLKITYNVSKDISIYNNNY